MGTLPRVLTQDVSMDRRMVNPRAAAALEQALESLPDGMTPWTNRGFPSPECAAR